MAKAGFWNIGFIENKDYSKQLKEKMGKPYYDYTKFDSDIDKQWNSKKGLRCFNADLTEVDVNASNIMFFLLDTGYTSKEDGKKLYGGFWSSKGSSNLSSEGQWTGVHIGTEDELVFEFEQKRSPNLKDWAFLRNDIIEKLANDEKGLALREKWYYGEKPASDADTYRKYPILWSYLNNTFKKLWRDGKDLFIPCVDKYASFNTGLVNRNYADIYALFEKNQKSRKQEWILKDFVVPGQGNNGKLINEFFNPLPKRANYFKNVIDVLYYTDTDMDTKTGELSCDWPHIITERCERYPIEFFKTKCPDGFTDIDGHKIEEISQTADAELRKDYFNKLGEKIAADEEVFRNLTNCVWNAIELAEKRVKWNYKTAVPMYYPTNNTNAFLLPLAIMKDDVIDLALVVERLESGNYQGHTILSLSMAYNNSRLITRPDSDWLSTEQIADIAEEDI